MCDSWHGIHGRRWWWWCFILWWRSRPSVWKSWSDVPCKLARALGTILYCRDWDNSEVWWTFSAIRFQPNLSSVCHAHGWLWIRCVARGFTSASNAKESRGIPCVKSSRARQKPHHLPQTKGRAQTRISFWTAVQWSRISRVICAEFQSMVCDLCFVTWCWDDKWKVVFLIIIALARIIIRLKNLVGVIFKFFRKRVRC